MRTIIDSGWSFAPRIHRDPISNTFRCWYRKDPDPNFKLLHKETTDPLDWSVAPTIIRSGITKRGNHIIDEGIPGPQRFKNLYSFSGEGIIDGVYPETSADGLTWSATPASPIYTNAQADDIVEGWKHPFVQNEYGVFVKRWIGLDPNQRRETWAGRIGPLFQQGTVPTPAFFPDALDTGVTQFYGAAGPLMRDGVAIFFLRILRDDIAYGVGYTTLAWTYDGETFFIRAREPFLAGERGKPDAAIAWIYGVTEHDGTILFSCSGYNIGHKVGTRSAYIVTMPSAALSLSSGPLQGW